MRRVLPLLTVLALALPASAAQARLHLVRVGNFASPIYATAPPGDTHRLFVVERGGRIVVLRGGRRLRRPFLDIRGQVSEGGERGLLSMAFAPDYARSGRFYVDFTDRTGDIRVVGYRRSSNPNRASASSAPSLGTLLGKLLRIDPRPAGGYSIPRGNPFRGRRERPPEIYAYGLRNPWRFSFDRSTGALVIGDVGQDRFEEIDYEPHGASAGRNFGWGHFEGFSRVKRGPTPHYAPPVLVRSHSAGSARSSEATWRADPRRARCADATCTATSATRACSR